MALTEGICGLLSVSAATPATFDADGYAALSWTEVGEASKSPNSARHILRTRSRRSRLAS